MASKSLNSVGFFDLPREIRDIIYCDLLTSGHIAILRTSRAVHWEASTFISKEGVLRCTILARRQPHSLCFQNLNLVQNLDIHLDLWNIYYKEIPKFLRTLRDFEGSSIPRQTLRITLLDSRSARPASNNGRQRLLLEQLTAFTGFEKITVNHMARDALGNPPHLLEVVGKPFNGLELGVNRACWELMDKV
ncbi:hypothetical protein MMC28_010111, partial [Mycoblastus sanguinarius]|nr:hypothetical protein [Mycoblastus sanguinarius]